MYRSLNEYIARLEREGELIRIGAPVSPVEEIAEITDRISKTPGGGKALLFENTGTAFPVLTNLFGSERRMALALGVGTLDELSERIDVLLKQAAAPRNSLSDKLRALPMLAEMVRWFPRTVSGRGACQQVVLTGAEAALSALPVLKCWPADGGHFVTLPMVNTVDPETGVRNVGTGMSTRPERAITTLTSVWAAGCPSRSRWAAIPPIPTPRRLRCPTTWTNTCWPGSCAVVR